MGNCWQGHGWQEILVSERWFGLVLFQELESLAVPRAWVLAADEGRLLR